MKPRLGFLGTGWIGRNRMAALCASGVIEAAAISDPDAACLAEAASLAPTAHQPGSLDEMLELDLDGLVIATPSALHAGQAIAALDRGLAVFCQKPLGRVSAEVEAVIAAARRANRLLGADFSYRHLAATAPVRALCEEGTLGRVFAADLVFHNAYGPDKDWFYDRSFSGGGCLIDLGVHLVDLALWCLGFPEVEAARGALFQKGERLHDIARAVEDHATAQIDLGGGISVRLACSWRLHAGEEAQISATFHGTQGSAEIRNTGGSFYDFEAWHMRGTSRDRIASPPDEWGGRAAVAWAERLARGCGFDPDAARFAEVARVIDRIYASVAPSAAGRPVEEKTNGQSRYHHQP